MSKPAAGVSRSLQRFSRLQPGVSRTEIHFLTPIRPVYNQHIRYRTKTSMCSTFEWSLQITAWGTPCSIGSQNPFSGDSSSIATVFACLDSLAHVVGLSRVSVPEVEGVTRNLYLTSIRLIRSHSPTHYQHALTKSLIGF